MTFLDIFYCFQPLEVFENKCFWFIRFLSLSNNVVVSFNLEFIDFSLLVICFFVVIFILYFCIFYSNYLAVLLRVFYFVESIVLSQVGVVGFLFMPLMFLLFFFILFSNVLGLVPISFCLTSQLLITFCLSFSVFLALTIHGFLFQGVNFLLLFVPKNVPNLLLPFLTLIELVSYLSRVFSLSIRLFANMVAGHALLHILTGAFVLSLKNINNVIYVFFMLIPFIILCLIIILETGIAFLQSYVFIVLVVIYMSDSFGLSSH